MKDNFNNFNDVADLKLRVYNRAVQVANLVADFGDVVAAEYLEQFSEGERVQILVMVNYIKAKGPEEVSKEMIRTVEPTGYDEQETEDDRPNLTII